MMAVTRREIWFALFVMVVFALGVATGLVFARYLGILASPGAADPARLRPGWNAAVPIEAHHRPRWSST